MHSLLERQIRKFLPDDLKNHQEINVFFDSIEKSYSNYEERLKMIERATSLSSQELYEANKKLNKETESQKKILETLSKTVSSIESTSKKEDVEGTNDFDPLKLVEDIENQTNRIIEITAEKDVLLKNLEQQNESLNNYAHMVSHDLKSPIRNIYSLVSWVFEDSDDGFKTQSKNSFDLIFQNLTKMDGLIDGILRHSIIDSLEENTVDIDINLLVEEIKNTVFVPENVEVKISSKLPTLFAGKYRMEQLFKNLITNAITATEQNDIGEVIVGAEEKDNNWIFSIKDNGSGIPEHLQTGIFDMFKKLENDTNATGIGLALVKKVINFYEGDIWLSSEEGMGTTFFFTLKTKQKDGEA